MDVDWEELIWCYSRNEGEEEAMGIEDMMNKRIFLRSRGENRRCCPEQSGVIGHLAGGFISSNRLGGELWPWY